MLRTHIPFGLLFSLLLSSLLFACVSGKVIKVDDIQMIEVFNDKFDKDSSLKNWSAYRDHTSFDFIDGKMSIKAVNPMLNGYVYFSSSNITEGLILPFSMSLSAKEVINYNADKRGYAFVVNFDDSDLNKNENYLSSIAIRIYPSMKRVSASYTSLRDNKGIIKSIPYHKNFDQSSVDLKAENLWYIYFDGKYISYYVNDMLITQINTPDLTVINKIENIRIDTKSELIIDNLIINQRKAIVNTNE